MSNPSNNINNPILLKSTSATTEYKDQSMVLLKINEDLRNTVLTNNYNCTAPFSTGSRRAGSSEWLVPGYRKTYTTNLGHSVKTLLLFISVERILRKMIILTI